MKITLTIFLMILSSAVLQAQPKGFSPVKNTSKLAEEIKQKSASIKSITSNFVQRKKMVYLDETIESKGKFWVNNQGQLRWEYSQPFLYSIYISNGKFSIKDEGKVKEFDMNSNKAFQEINNLIVNMLRGDLLSEGRFESKMYESGSQYLLKIKPKDKEMQKVVSETEIYLDKKTLTVSKVVMLESETDFTTIVFNNRKYNETIPAHIFSAK